MDVDELIENLYNSDEWIHGASPKGNIGWKMHISVHPDDYPEFVKSVSGIIEDAISYGAGCKFAPISYIEKGNLWGSQEGKFIVLYFPEESSHAIRTTLERMEREFRRGGFRAYKLPPYERKIGKEGIAAVRFSEFYGHEINVPESYRKKFGDELSDDYVRRSRKMMGVPPWKSREFYDIFERWSMSREESEPQSEGLSSELDELGKTLYKVAESLNIRDPKDYIDDKIEAYKMRDPVTIPRRGTYKIKLKGSDTELAYIENGRMRSGRWSSPLRGELYVLGRDSYFKEDEGALYRRDLGENKGGYVSRIQLVIKPERNEIEIFNVGLDEIEVISYSENKRERGRKLVFIISMLFSLSTAAYLFGSWSSKTVSGMFPLIPFVGNLYVFLLIGLMFLLSWFVYIRVIK